MDRQAAAHIILDTFDHPFDEARFQRFVLNLLNDLDSSKTFDRYGNFIPDSFKGHIRRYKRLGKYHDPAGDELDVLTVQLVRETALERARTTQRNFVAWYLKNKGEKDAALVAYYADNSEDWRFSFVRMEYRQEVTEAGTVRVREELTPARRYSFLVGKDEPNHTAQEQLLPILEEVRQNPTIGDLEKTFSVEAVTSRFYQEYRGLFETLTEEIDGIAAKDPKVGKEFESKSIDTANFAKKLLGQIVFLYFLQKKGWLGVRRDERGNFKSWGHGPKDFIKKLFNKHFISYENFFNDIIEPLFYEALAYERENDYYARLDIKIPFLNGGLFEPINGYNWQETDILISNDFFDEVFSTFDTYNFTVCEDEPLEKEVAVDPEMLGKVFENLLPNNLRKGQGTYYTPRTIVHYMCQESLIHYLDSAVNTGKVPIMPDAPEQTELFGNSSPKQIPLKTFGRKTIVPKQDIADLVRKGEFAIEHDAAKKGGEKAYKQEGTKSYKYQVPESIREHAKILDEKLKNIKVCDPAVGSGAFAVGMMHEIVKARSVLSTYLENESERSIYDLKRNCIQQSIYGVDIDPSAIDIAQLRLWLSLVVDEDDYHSIKPLPNLDYKIMQGDSLVEKFHGISLDTTRKKSGTGDIFRGDSELDRMIEDLHRKQNDLFSAIHVGDKKRLKREVEESIVDIFHYELERQKKDYFREIDQVQETASSIPNEGDRRRWIEAEKAKLDEKYGFNPKSLERELREMTHGNMARNFFPWKLYFADVFRKNGGFDITIANPPYVRQETIKPLKPKLKDEFGEFFCGTSDLYTYFYKRGLKVLKDGGHLCFIAPNKFMRAAYGKNTRELLTTKAVPKVVIDFGDLPIFDATTYPAILLLEKNKPQPEERAMAATFTGKEQIEQVENTLADIGFPMKVSALSRQGWNLERPEVLALMDKLKAAGTPLGKYVRGNFYYGIKTGLNKAFVIDGATRDRLMAEDPNSEKVIKPWLRGRDIKRWKTEWAGLYVIFTRRGVDINSYPAIKRYLEQFHEDLEPKKSSKQKRGRKPGSYKWYEIQDNIAYYKKFERPKIVYPEVSEKQRFAIDSDQYFTDKTTFIIPFNAQEILFIVALANSRLMSFFHQGLGSMMRGRYFMNSKIYIEQIPIYPAFDTQKSLITELVEKILSNPDSPDVHLFEKEIDALVYDLYGLTPDEIAIVEGKRKNGKQINYPA